MRGEARRSRRRAANLDAAEGDAAALVRSRIPVFFAFGQYRRAQRVFDLSQTFDGPLRLGNRAASRRCLQGPTGRRVRTRPGHRALDAPTNSMRFPASPWAPTSM